MMSDIEIVTYVDEHFEEVSALWEEAFPNDQPWNSAERAIPAKLANPLSEEAGVLKMDFLGLRTLNILKTSLELIEQNHGIAIDIDLIPLDDKKTFELYQHGDTIGTFQFESPGMQKYLRDLKPDKFDDLTAMNALYRPGPMAYIPAFIDRKAIHQIVFCKEFNAPAEKQEDRFRIGIRHQPKTTEGHSIRCGARSATRGQTMDRLSKTSFKNRQRPKQGR